MESKMQANDLVIQYIINTVKTSLKRTSSGPFVKIAQSLLTINIQRLLCTVIKFHVVKEAIQSSSSLPFITNFNLFVNAKTLTYYSTYFKDVIHPPVRNLQRCTAPQNRFKIAVQLNYSCLAAI